MEGGALVGESLIVTLIVVFYFGCFFIFSHKAEKEIEQLYAERAKTSKKAR